MFASPVVFASHSSLVTALFNFSVVKFIGVKKINALMAGKAAAASHGRQMHHGCQGRMIRLDSSFCGAIRLAQSLGLFIAPWI
jgi:hypothetical protein